MIRVAHEAPLYVFDEVRNETDYDYALVHLFEDEQIGEEYFECFVDSLKQGREVFLDNSIFELGHAFDSAKFRDWILKLMPTHFIVPDVLNDCGKTMGKYVEWVKHFDNDIPSHIKRIGVVQGNTWDELMTCATFMNEVADYVAVSFDYPFFEEMKRPSDFMLYDRSDEYRKQVARALGRIEVVLHLLRNKIVTKPIHLLGCSTPYEFEILRSLKESSFADGIDLSLIRSLDTSNPVMSAIVDGFVYRRESERAIVPVEKPKGLLADRMNEAVSGSVARTIISNVRVFRTLTR